MKFFNTAGPVNQEDHYCLPPTLRIDGQELYSLIEQKKYFILHAPRQTGKTSTMIGFAKQLNQEGKFTALYVNIEAAQAMRGKVKEGLSIVLDRFKWGIQLQLGENNIGFRFFASDILAQAAPGNELLIFLQYWAQHNPKPLVIFIDEIDSLMGDTLLSVLRQLRSGYADRPKSFPQAVCLIGVRDVRDYRIWSEEQGNMILGGSAFNIKSDSLLLGDFTKEQMVELYLQHTKETGQQFTTEALDYAFELTRGQPWLVNALAYQATFKDVKDRTQAITKEIIEQAKETLILRRDTHLDQLVDKLREPRVRNIIDAIIVGKDISYDFPVDDIQYVRDLGFIKQKAFEIANPIYQEVFPRELTYSTQVTMPQQQVWYVDADGSLNMTKMLEAFTEFYRENSAVWLEKFAYKESGPHLLLMAFLQRIINGGGKINREYALGTERVDLLLLWQTQRIVVELKVWRNPQKTLIKGLEQTASYMDTANATEGHLVIFDRREDKSWDEKIYTRQESVGGKSITIWGL
jgi:hypothetical protein